jgi:hypothetical protein
MMDNRGIEGDMETSAEADSKYLSSLEKDQDALLAQELSALSMQERERVYHGIHGVSEHVDEAPEVVEEKLAKLDDKLAEISRNKDAYLQAMAQDKDYTSCRRLRLKFLRANDFDVRKAAVHICLFFEEKLNLFGRELLAKDLKISDLDADDIKYLEMGGGQLVPQKDRAGRCIFAWIMANVPHEGSEEHMAKLKVRRNCVSTVSLHTTCPILHLYLFRRVRSTTC